MASKKNNSEVAQLISAYEGAVSGVRSADEGLTRVKGVASAAALKLAQAVGVDPSKGGSYAALGQVADPTFKKWWDGAKTTDKTVFARRCEIGAGYKAPAKDGAKAKAAGSAEAVFAFIDKVTVVGLLDQIEEACKARRVALAEAQAKKAEKAKPALPVAAPAPAAAGFTPEMLAAIQSLLAPQMAAAAK